MWSPPPSCWPRTGNRAQLDAAVGVKSVERFLGDEALRKGWQVPVDAAPTGKRVLVVGAGPSGLSAAYHLARLGHWVTIKDAGAAHRRHSDAASHTGTGTADWSAANVTVLGTPRCGPHHLDLRRGDRPAGLVIRPRLRGVGPLITPARVRQLLRLRQLLRRLPGQRHHQARQRGVQYEIDYDYCKGCGLCAAECPCGAIEMEPEPS